MPRKPTHQHDFSQRPLGGWIPTDRKHVERFPALLSDVNPNSLPKRPASVTRTVGFRYDQGKEGACVGNASAGWCSAATFAHSAEKVQYDAPFIYHEAQKIDEYPGEDYSGTSVRAGLEVIRTLGAPRLSSPNEKLFISEYKWATGVEDILNHVALVAPVVCGLSWYTNFDQPAKHPFNNGRRQTFFIGEGDLGSVRGGHAILLMGYYRNRQGQEWVRFQNSWGHDYPLVWMPTGTLQELWNRGELEAGLISPTAASFVGTPGGNS